MTNDTIAAPATAPGQGALTVVRVSGPRSVAAVDALWRGMRLDKVPSHTARFGYIIDPEQKEPLDQCVATVFRAPKSYTGEDTVELSLHGSPYIRQRVMELLMAQGVRLAEPGEFTQRAFINGRFDLARAEAVADMIAARTRGAQQLAMKQMRGGLTERLEQLRSQFLEIATLIELENDFSEEDVEFASREQLAALVHDAIRDVDGLLRTFRVGNAIKEGVPVAIIGTPNVGKSSLLNALVGEDRAIVSEVPGTTRDTIETTFRIRDLEFRMVDTAGLRRTDDPVETLGISRSRDVISRSAIVLRVTDATRPYSRTEESIDGDAAVIDVVNKIDLMADITIADGAIAVSARTGEGIDALVEAIYAEADRRRQECDADVILANLRHARALALVIEHLRRLDDGLKVGLSGDLLALDLRHAIDALGQITGRITDTDVLANVFKTFCIGK